jgi:hypothetical protein
MTTTAERYAPPRRPGLPARTDEATDVLPALSRAARLTTKALVSLTVVTTRGEGLPMAPERRAELLRDLAALSVDPDSMDRESEVDIWGFHDRT